jgi:hypothetical protein
MAYQKLETCHAYACSLMNLPGEDTARDSFLCLAYRQIKLVYDTVLRATATTTGTLLPPRAKSLSCFLGNRVLLKAVVQQ